MLHLGRGQHLGEGVSHHVICWAVNKLDGALLNNPTYPVIPHVDVLHAWVVLVVACECNGCLVVGKQSGGQCDGAKHLGDEAAKPQGFLATMCRRDVLPLGGGQGDDLLLLRGPRDGAAVDKKGIAGDGVQSSAMLPSAST